jgi:hypothetical protein
MATAVLNYQGLKKRETYDQIVDNLRNRQEKVRFPNRLAKQIRNSPQLSNLLDGDGMGVVDMEKHQLNVMKEQQKENAIRQAGGTAQVLRALGETRRTQHYSIAGDNESQMDDFQDAISNATDSIEDDRDRKLAAVRSQVANELQATRQQDYIGGLTEEQLRTAEQIPARVVPEGGLSAGVLENTVGGVADVVVGGAKLAVAGTKALYNTTQAGIGLARAVGVIKGGSSSSSSSGNGNGNGGSSGSHAFPMSNAPRLPPPPRETLAEEHRRRSRAGERADDVLDDFLRREGKRRSY